MVYYINSKLKQCSVLALSRPPFCFHFRSYSLSTLRLSPSHLPLQPPQAHLILSRLHSHELCLLHVSLQVRYVRRHVAARQGARRGADTRVQAVLLRRASVESIAAPYWADPLRHQQRLYPLQGLRSCAQAARPNPGALRVLPLNGPARPELYVRLRRMQPSYEWATIHALPLEDPWGRETISMSLLFV